MHSFTFKFKVKAVVTIRQDPEHNVTAVERQFLIDPKRFWDQSFNNVILRQRIASYTVHCHPQE